MAVQQTDFVVHSAVRCSIGNRSNNEDYAALFEPTDPTELSDSGRLYIVADGVGGASDGERASQYATKKVLHLYYDEDDLEPGNRLARAMQQAGNDIFDYIERVAPNAQMATTMVAAIIRRGYLTIANVGDSRGYLLRNGISKQITIDHNLTGPLVHRGEVTELEAFRRQGRNPLMRSLGGERNVSVDVFEGIPLESGNKILLCTDGLSRYTLNTDINQLASVGTPREIADRCVDFAYQQGAVDNVTVLVVQIGELVRDLKATGRAEAITAPPSPVSNIDEFDTDPTDSRNYQRHLGKSILRKRQIPLIVAGAAVLIAAIVLAAIFLFPRITDAEAQPTVTAEMEGSSVADLETAAEQAITEEIGDGDTGTLSPSTSECETGTEDCAPEEASSANSQPGETATAESSPPTSPTSLEPFSGAPAFWDDAQQVCKYIVQDGDTLISIYGGFQKANGFPDVSIDTLLSGKMFRDAQDNPITNPTIGVDSILIISFVDDRASCQTSK